MVQFRGRDPYPNYPPFHFWLEVVPHGWIVDFTIAYHLVAGKQLTVVETTDHVPVVRPSESDIDGLVYSQRPPDRGGHNGTMQAVRR
jgi:hypothetical protein